MKSAKDNETQKATSWRAGTFGKLLAIAAAFMLFAGACGSAASDDGTNNGDLTEDPGVEEPAVDDSAVDTDDGS